MARTLLALALALSACGGSVAPTTTADAGAPDVGAPLVPEGCTMHATAFPGGAAHATGTRASYRFAQDGRPELHVSCTVGQTGARFIFYFVLTNADAPGQFFTQGTLYREGSLSSTAPCAVDVTEFGIKSRTGLRASFACKDLGAMKGTLNLGWTEPAPIPSGPPQTSKCALDVTGAFVDHGEGSGIAFGTTGNVWTCSAATKGRSYSLIASDEGRAQLAIDGNTWCSSCGVEYRTSASCTISKTRDDGAIDGAYAGAFQCPPFAGADGTTLTLAGSLDTVRVEPPK